MVPCETIWQRFGSGKPSCVRIYFCLVALLDEFHRHSRCGWAQVNVVDDLCRLNDLVVYTRNRILAYPADVHFLSKRTAHAKVHRNLDLGGVLATGPSLQQVWLCPCREHTGTRSIKDPRDLHLTAGDLDLGFHRFFSFCCSSLSNSSSASNLESQNAAHWAIQFCAGFSPVVRA